MGLHKEGAGIDDQFHLSAIGALEFGGTFTDFFMDHTVLMTFTERAGTIIPGIEINLHTLK